MKVMNWEYMYLAVLIGGQQFKWMKIDKDEDLISLLISLEQKFWERVKKKDPPPIFGNSSDTEILKYLYPDAKEEEPVKLPDEALNLIEQYQQANEEEKAARYRKDEASNRMKAMLQDHSEGIWGSYHIYWKNVVSRKLDTKRLKTESPDIYEKYLSETSYRKFGIKEDKLNG
jgi:predicted phage-related endonuclease